MVFESEDSVGRHRRIDGEVGTAFSQLQSLGSGIGHHGKTYAAEMRDFAPVRVVPLENDFLVRFRADELEGAGANGMARDFIATAVRHDADGAVRKIPEKGRRGFL